MATAEKPASSLHDPRVASLVDEQGDPWLENGERMDSKTFLERYEGSDNHRNRKSG
jgi:hypothetical protein